MAPDTSEPSDSSAWASPGDRLDSWKEIAAYVKRDVRTVQRWEKREGLPVHRHLHDKLGTVYAHKSELDAWWSSRRPRLEQEEIRSRVVWHQHLPWLIAGAAAVLLVVLVAFNVGGWRDRLFGRTPRIQSLAVLPLENLSNDPAQEYFADGMTDALITNLAKMGTLRVISRTSAMQYKDADKPLPEIARELNVEAVVAGSVLRVGDRVRINVQLLHARTDQHLWAESYERNARDVMLLQNEVALAVARAIRLELSPEKQVQLAGAHPVNPAAYEAYLKGRYYWNKRSEEGYRRAIQYFEEALKNNADYAQAYAGLADTYTLLGAMGNAILPRDVALQRAKEASEQALELDETLAEAHTSLALVLNEYEWDWPGVQRQFQRALALDPGYATARHWYGYALMQRGRFAEALAEMKQAQQLDPLSLIINANLGFVYYSARHYDQALEQLRRTIEMDADFPVAHGYLALVLEQTGRYPEAIAAFENAIHLSGGTPEYFAALAHLYAVRGKTREAEQILEQLTRKSKEMFVPAFSRALVYVGLGQKQRALDWLERAYQERSGYLLDLKVDPRFDSLRSEPRFQQLLRRIGFLP